MNNNVELKRIKEVPPMSNKQLALTIDIGTQSCRTSLIDKEGNIVAIEKKKYDPVYVSPQKGFAEQDADFYWNYIKENLKNLTSNNKEIIDGIVGATITTFRDTSVQLDKDLKPIRNCILWLDQRTSDAKEKIPVLYSFLFKLIGMQDAIELNRKRTVAHWLKENEPETWANTYKYVNISSYLTYKLTGNLVDSSASMIGHYPINFKGNKWYNVKALKACIYGLSESQLCELKQQGEVLGVISDELAEECGLPKGIKLYATGSDKACETVGLGALSRDIGAISYGTASTIEVSNTKYYEPEKFLPAYPAAVPGYYNMEVQIYRGYWMLTWFSKEFASELVDEAKIQKMAVEELLNSNLSKIAPGSDGLVLQPYWGPGLSRPLSKGSIIGFTDIHTKFHLYRAIIEGIAYGLREGLEGIEKSQHHKVKELMISGGGSRSEAICQITADVFGLPVSRVQTIETTSLGAAIAVFVAAGEFKNVEEATKAMSHRTKKFIPNEKAHEKYNFLYKKVYLKMFPQLKNIYKDITKYRKKNG